MAAMNGGYILITYKSRDHNPPSIIRLDQLEGVFFPQPRSLGDETDQHGYEPHIKYY